MLQFWSPAWPILVASYVLGTIKCVPILGLYVGYRVDLGVVEMFILACLYVCKCL